MKAKTLKELLSHVEDDIEVYLASDAHDYWKNVHANPVDRIETETVVWDANGRSYRLLKAGESVRDFNEESNRPPLRVLVLK